MTFEGADEQVIGAGISPLPVQRPIPIWIGGSSPRAYERIGRLADGWFPQVAPGPALDEARGIVDQAAREAGRDPAGIGLEGRVSYTGDLDAALASRRDLAGRRRHPRLGQHDGGRADGRGRAPGGPARPGQLAGTWRRR